MEWIDAEIYVPSRDGFVFIVLENDAVAVSPYSDGTFLESVFGDKIKVKYWMPIPPLPKRGNNAKKTKRS